MKGIACAFEGRLGRDAEVKTARASGRRFVALSVIEGEGDEAQWVNVLCWSDSLADIVPSLVKGVEVYVRGKIRLRSWDSDQGTRYGLSVSAELVEPLALIGRDKPKAPPKARGKAKVDSQAPLEKTQPFNDALPF